MEQAHSTQSLGHPTPAQSSIGQSIARLMRRTDTNVVIATVALFILFSASNENFFSQYNLFNVSRTAALHIFISLGQMIVVVIGGLNLSLGNIGGLSVVAAGWAMEKAGWDPALAVVLALLVGVMCGWVNGFCIIKTKLHSFVITLATSFIFAGLVTGVSEGFPYTEIPREFTRMGRESVLGVPYLFLAAIFVLIVLWYLFRYTVVGRQILATGGNIEAAQLSGIRTNRIVLLCHMLSGFFAAVTGLLWVSRMGSAQPATGSDWLIISFAVAIIGGTALSGGETSMLGIFASGILLTLIKNGLIMLDVNVYFEQTYLGLIILLAVSVDRIRYWVSVGMQRLRRGAAHTIHEPKSAT